MKTPLFFAMLACTGLLHAQVLIDDFSSGEFTSGPTSPNFFTSTGTMLGGHRDSLIEVPGSSAMASVAAGVLTLQVNPDSQGGYVGRWGRNSVSEGNDLHIDFRNKSFAFDVLSFPGPFSVNVGVRSFNGSIMLIAGGEFEIAETGTHYFRASEFNLSGQADFADIAGVQIGFPNHSTSPGTYVIDNFQLSLVPEPAQTTFVSACAAVLLGVAWRLKARKSSNQ